MTKHSFRITKPVKELTNLSVQNQTTAYSDLFMDTVEFKNFHKPLAEAFHEPTMAIESNGLVAEFTDALIAKNLTALSNLLADDGAFIVLNKNLETVPVIKEHYVSWLRFKLQTESVTSVETDSCTGCTLGKNVVLYNHGGFPWAINDLGGATKAGLNFTIKNGKIASIRFCFRFKNTKNQYGYEKRFHIYQEYMAKGYDTKEANRLSGEEWNTRKHY